MSDMVKALLEKVPSERHLPADIFVQAALENRWPCKKKGGGV
jgi:antitoxin component of RelBE/YafQ-DinJ toxin-antitoxin module